MVIIKLKKFILDIYSSLKIFLYKVKIIFLYLLTYKIIRVKTILKNKLEIYINVDQETLDIEPDVRIE